MTAGLPSTQSNLNRVCIDFLIVFQIFFLHKFSKHLFISFRFGLENFIFGGCFHSSHIDIIRDPYHFAGCPLATQRIT